MKVLVVSLAFIRFTIGLVWVLAEMGGHEPGPRKKTPPEGDDLL